MAANSAGVMPANSSPPLEPEGGSTHTPPARRKPDRVLLGHSGLVAVPRMGVLAAWKDLRMLESTMEVIWDLVAFLALVAVGLVGLAALARTTH